MKAELKLNGYDWELLLPDCRKVKLPAGLGDRLELAEWTDCYAIANWNYRLGYFGLTFVRKDGIEWDSGEVADTYFEQSPPESFDWDSVPESIAEYFGFEW